MRTAQAEETYGLMVRRCSVGRVAADSASCPRRAWTVLSGLAERRRRGWRDGFAVVAHLLDPDTMTHLLLRTRIPRDEPRLASVTSVHRGASWHERETAEMFGVVFDDHPDPVPLLLPDGFDGHPLRKDFVLAARVVKAWPGAAEPGDADRGRSKVGASRVHPVYRTRPVGPAGRRCLSRGGGPAPAAPVGACTGERWHARWRRCPGLPAAGSLRHAVYCCRPVAAASIALLEENCTGLHALRPGVPRLVHLHRRHTR
ncbi:MAG: NADH-quinone oxidoreductase subunit C [Geodermatophilaceae bacterium]